MRLSTKHLLFPLRRQTFIVRLWLDIKKRPWKNPFVVVILFVKMNLWADQSFEIMEQCKAFRFHTPSSLMVVCLSGCSKTVFTTKLLVNNLDSFERPPIRFITVTERGNTFLSSWKNTASTFTKGSWLWTLAQMVSRGWIIGVGWSHGRGRERQMRVGSVCQTFASSEHYCHVFVSRHVPTR